MSAVKFQPAFNSLPKADPHPARRHPAAALKGENADEFSMVP
jgi:hypothetical protein